MINLYNQYFMDIKAFECIVYNLSEIDEIEKFDDIRSTVTALRDIDFKDQYYVNHYSGYESYSDIHWLYREHLSYYHDEILVWLLEQYEYESDILPSEQEIIYRDASMVGLLMCLTDLDAIDLQYSLEYGYCELVLYDSMYYLVGVLMSKEG